MGRTIDNANRQFSFVFLVEKSVSKESISVEFSAIVYVSLRW